MIERARRRNSRHAGVVDFVVSAIAEISLTAPASDIAFAVDVNVFGDDCSQELQRIRAHMRDAG